MEGLFGVPNTFQRKEADFNFHFHEALEKNRIIYCLHLLTRKVILPPTPSPKFNVRICQIFDTPSLPSAAEIICDSSPSVSGTSMVHQ